MWKLKIKSRERGYWRQSGFARYLAAFFIMGASLSLLISGCSSREIQVGEIKYKKVMGVKNGDAYAILTQNQGEPAKVDSIYQDFIPIDTQNIIISDIFADRLLTDFDDVRYFVGLELCDNEDLEEFKLGRDHFNKLRLLPGLIIKVEYETRGNWVISLIDY